MRKVLVLFFCIVALGALLSACDASITPVAARVNGTSISVSTLNDVMNAFASSPGYRCDLTADAKAASAATPVFSGVGNHTYASSFVAQQLGFLIGASAVQQGVASLHLPMSQIANDVAHLVLDSEFAPPSSSTCSVSGEAVLSGLAPIARNVLVKLAENEAVFAAHLYGTSLTPAGIATYEQHHRASTQLSCTDVILVPTSSKAAAVERQLAAGASFAAVAKADSTDTATAANGGSLGCVVSIQLPSPLNSIVEKIAIGKVSAAIPYGSDFVILVVTSRKNPSPETAGETIVATEEQASAYSAAIDAFYRAAHVEVSPGYGSWGEASGTYGVMPLSGPPVAILTNPAAVIPGSLSLSS